MRCELRRLLVLLVLTVLSSGRTALADTTSLFALDSYLATDSSDHDVAVADVAWSAHLEWRSRRRDATFDFVERESLIGGPGRRELHELVVVDRSFEPWSITLGRFRVPGGFWLIADGGGLSVRRDALELAVYGGARSFTNGRVETLLTRSPHFLPLVGAAITHRGDVQARLAYTYTRDRVVLPGAGTVMPSTQPEQFLDAEVLAQVGERISVTSGATMGTRYLVSYPTTAAQLADDPRLETMWFGSQAAYLVVDVRAAAWRFGGAIAALRTKLGQLTETPAAAAITGSFVEASARATWRRDRSWRVVLRYRARVWADTRSAHRAHAAATWRAGVLDVQLAAGIDVHAGATPGSGYVDRTTVLYRASVGRKTATSEVATGVAASSQIGDELTAGPGDDSGDTRAPYTLEARSYGFVRAFVTNGPWFGGVDVEVDLHGNGIRALLQAGWGR